MQFLEVAGPKVDENDVLLPGNISETSSESENIRIMENLSNKLTTYKILGLEPGEKYALQLGTKTGNVPTNRPIYDILLTRPLPLKGLRIDDIATNSCVVHWLQPSQHTCLKGFQIVVTSAADGKTIKEVAVPKLAKQFTVFGLMPGADYHVILTALCSAEEKRRTESAPVEEYLTTYLEKVKSFRQDGATEGSIVVRSVIVIRIYDSSISKIHICLLVTGGMEQPLAKNSNTFSPLPHIPRNVICLRCRTLIRRL